MEEIIPWVYWVDMIRPYYFSNKCDRKPIDIETMLRMYLMRVWFNLSDEGIEDSIYDSYAMCSFMRIDFNEQQMPDATTLLKFRHMLEKNKIGEKIYADVNKRLDESGLMMHGGTIVDASLIATPKSTKNKEGKRDPEIHQTKKGNEWHFGMKVHAGVDAGSGYVHTVTDTSANMNDVSETSKLLREDDHYYPDYAYNPPLFTEDMKVYSDSKISSFLRDIRIDDSIEFQNDWNGRKDHREKIYTSYDSTNKHCQAGEVTLRLQSSDMRKASRTSRFIITRLVL